MNNIRFICPRCTQSLAAPPEMAGQTIECPTCHHLCEVTNASVIAVEEPESKARGKSLGAVIAIAVIIVTFGIVLAARSSRTQKGEQPYSPPQKEYISNSFYDLREIREHLFDNSGLTSDDTQVKTDAVLNKIYKDFLNLYLGKYVKWSGGYIYNVEEKSGQYICKIEMDKDAILSTTDIQFPVTKEMAMELKCYKEVLIDGKIKSLDGTLKVVLEDISLTYTGRTLDDMCIEKTQAESK